MLPSVGVRMLDSKMITFVATQSPSAALKFYRDTLGLTLINEDAFAIVFDANGTMLRVQKVQELTPAKHTVLGWEVADIRAKAKELAERGIRFERYERMAQDEFGIWSAPSGAKVAW